ncbi:MAG TPA: 3-oxoacyl-[acyl-carrier-protein] reductase [Dehalococcoidia bacterium]|jgi:3-oxoacyl-[acyl-carrier protein] reductase|nr:3-oxoacyl-[acyl-carrier-protein] reductase [Dehalococcoidia bacterium]
MHLESRVAIVTGSARGIGQAIATKLAEHGATTIINDLDGGGAEQTAAQIRARGGQATAIVADISQADEAKRLVDETMASYGRLDILVNNAGITRDSFLLRMSEEDWDRVLNTNLKGAFLCSRAAVRPMMKQGWGRIINISSVAGVMGNAGQANYAAAKAGLLGLTKTVAREFASRGITVNAIAPGFIDTEMTRPLSEAVKQEFLRLIPVGYAGSPEDVAQAVLFLASEEARYITGQVLHVDGGMLMA